MTTSAAVPPSFSTLQRQLRRRRLVGDSGLERWRFLRPGRRTRCSTSTSLPGRELIRLFAASVTRQWRRQNRRRRRRTRPTGNRILPVFVVSDAGNAMSSLDCRRNAAVGCGGHDHVRSATAVLSLMTVCLFLADLPRVLTMPSRVYLARGLTGRVECPVDANPPVTLILWSRNGRTIDVTGSATTSTGSVTPSS